MRNIRDSFIIHLSIFLIFFFACNDLNAQIRKYSNEFLSLGIGAQALAMGNCNVSQVTDVSAIYWNPAGLSLAESDLQFGLMHAEYFAGIAKYDFGGVVVPTKDEDRFLGLGIIRFAIDDIPNTLYLIEPDGSVNYNNVTSFSAADYAFIFSYGQNTKIEGLRLGANFKTVHRSLGSFASSWGFGLDFGAQYDIGDLKLGFMARDITTTFNAWSFNFTDSEKEVLVATGNEIPDNSLELTMPKFIIGLSYDFYIKDKMRIRPAINIDLTTDGKRNVLVSADPISLDPHFGFEFAYSEVVYLRGGVNNIQRSADNVTDDEILLVQPNFGLGLKIKSVNIDYALTNVGESTKSMFSHIFSLSVNINKKIASVEE
jgi:hypothetical protein